MVVTLPDQHLIRPCLAESVLDIAPGSVVGGVIQDVDTKSAAEKSLYKTNTKLIYIKQHKNNFYKND